jgi:hypothetical protein
MAQPDEFAPLPRIALGDTLPHALREQLTRHLQAIDARMTCPVCDREICNSFTSRPLTPAKEGRDAASHSSRAVLGAASV